jgi:hypothetical protein
MKTLADDLHAIIKNGTQKYPLPQKIGNSIRLGKVIIRFSKKQNSYILYDCVDQVFIAEAVTKYGALATAKFYVANKPIDKVLQLDKQYIKHKNDCMAYRHTIKTSKDLFRAEIANTRLSVSQVKMDAALNDLEDIIFE